MQVKKLTDVCIIGSGPAGAATSMMLSKLKVNHIIIDKETFPRDKICGDGLFYTPFKF
jgi:flavin-dependent dehydrogenase